MNLTYCRHTYKAGESRDDYSDAFSPDPTDLPMQSHVFAMADGTTQGMLNREWARFLVRSFLEVAASRLDLREALLRTIDKSREHWENTRREYVAAKNSVLDENEYRWLFEYGSHATFIGLRFGSDYWEAVAVGDTCVFVLDRVERCFAFPVEKASGFTDCPELISSLSDRNADIDQRIRHVRKSLAKRHRFYLMTDALAQWFLSNYEMGKTPWDQIDNLGGRRMPPKRLWDNVRYFSRRFRKSANRAAEDTPSTGTSFEDWVGKLRESAEVVNDDATLAILRP